MREGCWLDQSLLYTLVLPPQEPPVCNKHHSDAVVSRGTTCKHKHVLSSQHQQGKALSSDAESLGSFTWSPTHSFLKNKDRLKIPGWRSDINPGFCKELGELILPLTIIWSDIKLECICYCKEFSLLFKMYCLSIATPLISNCLNKNWECTGWYKTLQ